jgi:hypothetical protein
LLWIYRAGRIEQPPLGTDCFLGDLLSLYVRQKFLKLRRIVWQKLKITIIAGADDGIETLVTSSMMLKCYQTRTGIKFVITAEAGPLAMLQVLEQTLREIYAIYTETVLKDPFYELEMPIRSEMFVRAVDALILKRKNDLQQSYNSSINASTGRRNTRR